LIPALWTILATQAVAGELRGTVRIVSDGGTMQASGLDPYAGTLNSAGKSDAGGRAHTTTPKDVVVYLEGPNARLSPRPSAGKPLLKQINQSFEPHVLGVPVGTTVDFPNGDLVYHNVFSYSKAKKFDLGYYGKGKSKTVTFDKAGIVQVFCDIHSTMSAYVLVVDSPFVTQPNDSGNYDFPELPPGKYTLRVWHPDLGDRSMTVTIGDGITDFDVNL
jgi:plastocyanin